MNRPERPTRPSRRSFLKASLAAATAAATADLSIARGAHAAGNELVRIALIGCGGRGTGAASQALATAGPVKLVAMADVFSERLEASLKFLSAIDEIRDRIDVPPERRFLGFDAYQKAIDA